VSILIIDDSKVDRIVTKVVLQKGGFDDLVMAESAVQALALLGVPEGEPELTAKQLDVILVDRQMPEMDGLEFCRTLHRDPQFHDIPIIMVTASDEEETLSRAFEAGAVDYVAKPIRSVPFLARIRLAMRLKKETDARKANEELLVQRYNVMRGANDALRNALTRIKKLPGRIPICSSCHKLCNEQGEWQYLDEYMEKNFDSEIQLSICPTCYGDRVRRIEKK